MKNLIIKFKTDLKQYQSARKKLLKQCEHELRLLEKLINYDPTVIQELNMENINESFPISTTLGTIDLSLTNFFDKRKRKKQKEKEIEIIKYLYDRLISFVDTVKREYIITQNIINSFDNDKVKDPINNMQILSNSLGYSKLTFEEQIKILGMAIYFNSQYAKKKKSHNIENIEAMHTLAENYFNQDGSFKYHPDTLTFERCIKEIINNNNNIDEKINILLFVHPLCSPEHIIELFLENNKKLSQIETPTIIPEESAPVDYTIPEKVINALKELKKYYKNGTLIAIPNDLDKFYQILEDGNIDEQEQKYIINLIKDALLKQKDSTASKYLSPEDNDIFEKSIKLLDSFTHSNADTYTLKQYIEELQTILSLLETETDEDNKEYLLSEIPNIIGELSQICSKYTEDVESNISSNRFIFLLNKEGIPFIEEDINSLDASYRKAICALIPKIHEDNKSQFRKIQTQDQFDYNMYEVITQRAHVAFVEIDAGIYVIIGANIPRNGYKELNNRLKANQVTILKIQSTIKNPETRNQFLSNHEAYLAPLVPNTDTSSTHKLKRTKEHK